MKPRPPTPVPLELCVKPRPPAPRPVGHRMKPRPPLPAPLELCMKPRPPAPCPVRHRMKPRPPTPVPLELCMKPRPPAPRPVGRRMKPRPPAPQEKRQYVAIHTKQGRPRFHHPLRHHRDGPPHYHQPALPTPQVSAPTSSRAIRRNSGSLTGRHDGPTTHGHLIAASTHTCIDQTMPSPPAVTC